MAASLRRSFNQQVQFRVESVIPPGTEASYARKAEFQLRWERRHVMGLGGRGAMGVLLCAGRPRPIHRPVGCAFGAGVQTIEHDCRTRCRAHQIGGRLTKPFARYRRVLAERSVKVQAKRLDCSFRIGLKFRIQLSCQGRCSSRARKLLGCCNRALLGRCGSDRRNELALPLLAAMLPQRQRF